MDYLEWDTAAIESLERGFRRDWFNRLGGTRLAWLLGSWSDTFGQNLGLFSNVVHLGANPPLLGLVFRPETVRRDSLQNIRDTRLFSLNTVELNEVERAHQTSAKYEAHINEFEAVGMEAEVHEGSPLPYVKNALLQLTMEPVRWHEMSNGCTFLEARAIRVRLAKESCDTAGLPDVSNWLHVNGLDRYMRTEAWKKMPHARS